MEKSFSLIIVLSVALSVVSAQRYTLYGPDDKVFLLNATTIYSNVFNSDKAWFIEFYANWCPHCQAYAPLYKKFAEEAYDWRNIAVIGALDCALPENTATCRDFQVFGYPTLRFFPPKYPQYKDQYSHNGGYQRTLNRGLEVEKTDNMSNLKRDLIDTLEVHYPKLLKFSNNSGSDTQQLLRWTDELFYPVRPTAVVVVFEGANSYLGKEVTLKLSIFKFIKVYRFLRSNNIYHALNLDTWPAAGFISGNGVAQRIDIGQRDWVNTIAKAVLEYAGVHVQAQRTPTTPRPRSTITPRSIEKKSRNENRTDVVSMDDLLHALHDTLYNEIPIVMPIQGAKLEALQKFIHAVSRFLPTDRRDIRAYFRLLHRWVLSKTKIEAKDFETTLERLENRLRPWHGVDFNQWDDCKGTLPGRRGYTCGLWRLFHTLTLVAVQRNANEGALDGIHAYVKEFFGCTYCKEHFLQMVDRDNILAHKSASTQALWLWKAHNEVNIRTKGTTSEDPGYPKHYYPNKKDCPECFDANDNYIEPKVLDYLLRIYTRPRRSYARQHTESTIVKPTRKYQRYPVRPRNDYTHQGFVQPRPYWSRQ